MSNYDFSVEDHGSLFLVTPHTDAARAWWDDKVGECQYIGLGNVVEHRFIQDISYGILEDGLTITKDGKTMQVADTGDLILV